MIDGSVVITPKGGSPVDYSSSVEAVSIRWPSTTELPTCNIRFNNRGGQFVSLPLYSTVAVTLPRGVGTFNFYTENHRFRFNKTEGHTLLLSGRSAPELVFLTEGNLDVVGTDLPVGEFGARASNANPAFYVPYPSTYVSTLQANLLDVGNALTTLLHTTQPNQVSAYRGRLGYDATGLGVKTATGLDYTAGALGYYIKGMWQVGLGATGSQKTGLDLIRDLVTKNLVDGNGNPTTLDWFVDPRSTPPLLNVFSRGSRDSAQALTVGSSAIQELDLPIDATDVRNFVIYWANAESLYPGGGDAWSNYSNIGGAPPNWVTVNNGGDAPSLLVANFGQSFGSTSIEMIASGNGGINAEMQFNIQNAGYRVLSQLFGMNLSAFQFYFYTFNIPSNIALRAILYDDINHAKVHQDINTFSGLTSANWFLASASIPTSGTSGWTVDSGNWDFKTAMITRIGILITALPFLGVDVPCYVDFVQFRDNWGFAPVYSYNPSGASSTLLSVGASPGGTVLGLYTIAGLVQQQKLVVGLGLSNQEVVTTSQLAVIAGVPTVVVSPLANDHTLPSTTTSGSSGAGTLALNVNSTAGFKVNQQVFINAGQGDYEIAHVASIGAGVLNLASPLVNTHGNGETVTGTETAVGATHDPASVSAYDVRMFPFVDFYVSNAGSDTASAIVQGILTQRKGKKSTGTIKLSGYASQVPGILPGYRFAVADPEDVYLGTAIDSVISGWLADEVRYDFDKGGGFVVTYTVEPYYSNFAPNSSDSNQRNLWRTRNLAQLIRRLQTGEVSLIGRTGTR